MRDRPLSRAVVIGTIFVIVALATAFLIAIASVGGSPEPGATLPGDTTTDASAVPDPVPLRVEVLNGAGKAGLARHATQQLRGNGFDVVFFGNAGRFDYDRSVVLDRSGAGAGAAALAVAAALGIDSVEAVPDASLLLDVSVILGSDWPPVPVDPATPIERLRRLLSPGDTAT